MAGVTISALSGDNGILQNAGNAKEVNEKAADIEKIKLAITEAQIGENGYQELTTYNLGYELIKDGTKAIVSDNEDGTRHILFLDEKKEYSLDNNGNIEDLNIDFDTKYVAPESQDEERNEGVIGIGTDGQPVDMDLWEYNFDDVTNGYGLNDSTSLTAGSSAVSSKGYNGMDFDNIVIPQYISTDDGESWTPVTNLDWSFYNCTNLEQLSELPDTVKSMRFTFRGCTNLDEICELPNGLENMLGTFMLSGITKAPITPQSVNNMEGTFNACSSLIEPPVIPNGVTSLKITFANCIALKYAPNIPDSVETMESTFEGCTSLETATTIPSSVTNIIKTYRGCTNLRGKLEINANVSGKTFLGDDGYERLDYFNVVYNATKEGLSLKLSGSCRFLNEIITETKNPRITL